MTSAVRHLTEAGFLGKFYIDGEWRKPNGSATAVVINPATEQPIAEVALGNDEDVEYAVAAARQAFAGWSRTPAAGRAALLARVHGLILERLELFAQAITSEIGAAITYARRAQVPLAAEHIRVARDNLATYSSTPRAAAPPSCARRSASVVSSLLGTGLSIKSQPRSVQHSRRAARWC